MRKSATTTVAVLVLSSASLGVLGYLAYSYRQGWLLPFWNDLGDGQGAILSQVVFLFAAAWAAVLVPVLFGDKIRNMEDAATQMNALAEKLQSDLETMQNDVIKQQENLHASLDRKVTEQFKSIMRYQQMALGFYSSNAAFDEMSNDERKAFASEAWARCRKQVDKAVRRLHGARQNALSGPGQYSSAWFDKLHEFGALGDAHEDFAKIGYHRGGTTSVIDLIAINEALRRVKDWSPEDATTTFAQQASSVAQNDPILNRMPAPPPQDSASFPEPRADGQSASSLN